MPKSRFDKHNNERCKSKANLNNSDKLTMELYRYMWAQHITAKSIAVKLNCTPQNVGYMLKRPAAAWNAAEVKKYAEAVNMPLDVAFSALAESLDAFA